MVHIVVRDAAATALAPVAGGHGVVSVVVVVVGFGVEGDDVPGVEEAGYVAEGAEEDVDEGVGGADAGFDPYGDGGEEDGEEAEEDVAAAHRFERVLGRWMLGALMSLKMGRLCLPGSLTIGEEKSEFSEVWLCGCASIQFSRVMGAREVGDEHQQRKELNAANLLHSRLKFSSYASKDRN